MIAVQQALARLKMPGTHVHNATQVENWAKNQWFNQESARQEFANYRDFAKAVVEAWSQQHPGQENMGQSGTMAAEHYRRDSRIMADEGGQTTLTKCGSCGRNFRSQTNKSGDPVDDLCPRCFRDMDERAAPERPEESVGRAASALLDWCERRHLVPEVLTKESNLFICRLPGARWASRLEAFLRPFTANIKMESKADGDVLVLAEQELPEAVVEDSLGRSRSGLAGKLEDLAEHGPPYTRLIHDWVGQKVLTPEGYGTVAGVEGRILIVKLESGRAIRVHTDNVKVPREDRALVIAPSGEVLGAGRITHEAERTEVMFDHGGGGMFPNEMVRRLDEISLSPLSAKKPVGEAQYRFPNIRYSASQAPYRAAVNPDIGRTFGGVKLSGEFRPGRRKKSGDIKTKLAEALEGMGSDHQPDELVQRLAAALARVTTVINNQRVPLNQALAKAGFQAKRTNDGLGGQAIIFSRNEQPVLQLSIMDLADESAFKDALDRLDDLAAGRAPGAGVQLRDALSALDKERKAAAQAVAPREPEEEMAVQQMGARREGIEPRLNCRLLEWILAEWALRWDFHPRTKSYHSEAGPYRVVVGPSPTAGPRGYYRWSLSTPDGQEQLRGDAGSLEEAGTKVEQVLNELTGRPGPESYARESLAAASD